MKWFAFGDRQSARFPQGFDSPQKLRIIRHMSEGSSVFRPMRWLAHLPLVVLPFLAAAVIDGPRLGPRLERSVTAALAGAGQGWAKPTVFGRDVEIRGVAPDRAAVDLARAVVEGTAGVRRVDMRVRSGP